MEIYSIRLRVGTSSRPPYSVSGVLPTEHACILRKTFFFSFSTSFRKAKDQKPTQIHLCESNRVYRRMTLECSKVLPCSGVRFFVQCINCVSSRYFPSPADLVGSVCSDTVPDCSLESVREIHPHQGYGYTLLEMPSAGKGFCVTSLPIPDSSVSFVRNLMPYRICPYHTGHKFGLFR